MSSRVFRCPPARWWRCGRVPGRRGGRVRGDHRTVRLRQVDAAASASAASIRRRADRCSSISATSRSCPRPSAAAFGSRASASSSSGSSCCRCSARRRTWSCRKPKRGVAGQRAPRAHARAAGLRGSGGSRRSSAVAALRRRNAACRDRPCAGEPAGAAVADEPTGELDEETGEHVAELFDRVNRDGTAVLVVTHNPTLAARASRRLSMKSGRLVE